MLIVSTRARIMNSYYDIYNFRLLPTVISQCGAEKKQSKTKYIDVKFNMNLNPTNFL